MSATRTLYFFGRRLAGGVLYVIGGIVGTLALLAGVMAAVGAAGYGLGWLFGFDGEKRMESGLLALMGLILATALCIALVNAARWTRRAWVIARHDAERAR